MDPTPMKYITQENRTRIVELIQRKAYSSCEAIDKVLGYGVLDSYRKHSNAREIGYSFHDIPFSVWVSMSRGQKDQLRIGRVLAWIESVNEPVLTGANQAQIHNPREGDIT